MSEDPVQTNNETIPDGTGCWKSGDPAASVRKASAQFEALANSEKEQELLNGKEVKDMKAGSSNSPATTTEELTESRIEQPAVITSAVENVDDLLDSIASRIPKPEDQPATKKRMVKPKNRVEGAGYTTDPEEDRNKSRRRRDSSVSQESSTGSYDANSDTEGSRYMQPTRSWRRKAVAKDRASRSVDDYVCCGAEEPFVASLRDRHSLQPSRTLELEGDPPSSESLSELHMGAPIIRTEEERRETISRLYRKNSERQQKLEDLRKKKQKKEMAHVHSKPTISETSRQLIAGSKTKTSFTERNQALLEKRKMLEEQGKDSRDRDDALAEECVFKPRISAASARIAAKHKSQGSLADRLYQDALDRSARLQSLAEKHQSEICKDRPTVDEKSKKMVSARRESVSERLHEAAMERARRQREKEEHEKETLRRSMKPTLCKHSEALLSARQGDIATRLYGMAVEKKAAQDAAEAASKSPNKQSPSKASRTPAKVASPRPRTASPRSPSTAAATPPSRTTRASSATPSTPSPLKTPKPAGAARQTPPSANHATPRTPRTPSSAGHPSPNSTSSSTKMKANGAGAAGTAKGSSPSSARRPSAAAVSSPQKRKQTLASENGTSAAAGLNSSSATEVEVAVPDSPSSPKVGSPSRIPVLIPRRSGSSSGLSVKSTDAADNSSTAAAPSNGSIH